MDPLANNFPSQSPYLFAYNSPIQYVDYNGKAGWQYLEIIHYGDRTEIKRIVELDILIGISDKSKKSSSNKELIPHFRPNDLPKFKKELLYEFNDWGFRDMDGYEVEFRFNFYLTRDLGVYTEDIKFNNEAELAYWHKKVDAFKYDMNGDGIWDVWPRTCLFRQHLDDIKRIGREGFGRRNYLAPECKVNFEFKLDPIGVFIST